MKYEWKQMIFKPEDFNGAGHYIVKENINKESTPFISDSGYLSTIMKKVGWNRGNRRESFITSNIYCLVDMSDGLITEGYFSNTGNIINGSYETPSEKWIWNEFSGENNYEGKQKLCEYLNNNTHGDTFRFATNEEVVRVVMYQRGYRTKN